MSLIAKNPSLLKERNASGQTVLLVAASSTGGQHIALIRELLGAGSDINARDNRGRTALIESVFTNHADVVAVLLSRRADWRLRDTNGHDAMYYSAFLNRVTIGRLLVQGGDEPSVFEAAALGFNRQVAHMLHADPSLAGKVDGSGYSALQWASLHGHRAAVSLILAYAPKLDVFSVAASGETRRLQQILIHSHAIANTVDKHGLTPLNWAVATGNYGAAQVLLTHGANPNGAQESPLLAAVRAGNIDLVELLLNFGADTSRFYPGFGTAATVALSMGRKDIAALLETRSKNNLSFKLVHRLSGLIPGVILLLSFLGKVLNFGWFKSKLRAYKLVPGRLASETALFVVFSELLLGLALTLNASSPWPAYAAAALLAAFSVAISVNIFRGRKDLECGCCGISRRNTTIRWRLVVKNLGLIGLVLTSTVRSVPSADFGLLFLLYAFAIVCLLVVAGAALLDRTDSRQRRVGPAHA